MATEKTTADETTRDTRTTVEKLFEADRDLRDAACAYEGWLSTVNRQGRTDVNADRRGLNASSKALRAAAVAYARIEIAINSAVGVRV